MTSSRTSVYCGNSRCPSCYGAADERRCRASTSRGLSHSSRESQHSAALSNCSYYSDVYVTEYYNRPCYIAESSELVHRSRWRAFKNLFKHRRYKMWLFKHQAIRRLKKEWKRNKKDKQKMHGNVTKELMESINSECSTPEQRFVHKN